MKGSAQSEDLSTELKDGGELRRVKRLPVRVRVRRSPFLLESLLSPVPLPLEGEALRAGRGSRAMMRRNLLTPCSAVHGGTTPLGLAPQALLNISEEPPQTHRNQKKNPKLNKGSL